MGSGSGKTKRIKNTATVSAPIITVVPSPEFLNLRNNIYKPDEFPSGYSYRAFKQFGWLEVRDKQNISKNKTFSEYFIGTNKDNYSDKEISYVLIELFVSELENGYPIFGNGWLDNKVIKYNDYLSHLDYSVQYEPYYQGDNKYALVSIINNKNKATVALLQVNIDYTSAQDTDVKLNNSFLNEKIDNSSGVITKVITGLLNSTVGSGGNTGISETGPKHKIEKYGIDYQDLKLNGIKGGRLPGKLKNQEKIIFMGKLSSKKKDLVEKVINEGGGVYKILSKEIDYLVEGNDVSIEKIAKAKSLGIKVITEDEFNKLLN